MRLSTTAALLISLLLASCRSGGGAAPASIAPDHAAWRGRVPGGESVQAYAVELKRLNPGEREEFDVRDGLTLQEAEVVALVFNPDLRRTRLDARVPLLGAQNSGVPDDPRFEFDLLRLLQGGATPWIAASGLKFTVPLSNRLAGERSEAFAEATAAWRAALAAEWDTVVQLRNAWSKWSTTRERISLLEEYLASVEEVLAIARVQRDAEQIGVTQVRVLELEKVSRGGDLVAERMRQQQQLLDLKALMGLTPHAEVELLPSFSKDPEDLDWRLESQQLVRVNLELALAEAEFIAADRTMRLEASKRFPDLEIGPLFESEEGVEQLGAGIGIPLPLWNRNRKAIAEACAARRAARAAYHARYQELIARLARSRAEGEATALHRDWLLEKVAPMADVQLKDVRRLGELGDMDVLILKDALSTVLDTKLQVLQARLKQSLAAIRRRALVEPLRTPSSESLYK